jgi:hypothetical protein
MLPFEPELVETMRLRYKDAIKDVVDIHKIAQKLIEPPSKNRRYVFDFYDGLRLIISKDSDRAKVFLHFSASMNPGSHGEFHCPKEFIDFVVEHIQDLTPDDPPTDMAEMFFTKGGILHILVSSVSGNTGPIGNICLN